MDEQSWLRLNEACLTNRAGVWEAAWIVALDSKRNTATLWFEDPDSDDDGWQFPNVPIRELKPVPDGYEPPARTPARDLVLQGWRCEDREEALTFYVKALELEPDNWYAAEWCGDIYWGLGNWASACEFYRRAAAHPDGARWPETFFSLALCLGKLRRRDEEAAAYRAALELDPDFPFARNNLGWSLMQAKKFTEAIPLFEEAIRRGNDGRYPVRNLPKALIKVGRFDEAVALLQKQTRGGVVTKAAERLIAQVRRAMEKASSIDLEPEEDDEGTPTSAPIERVPRASGDAVHREKHLEDEIIARMADGLQVFGRRLQLYERAGQPNGQQFPTSVGPIDILAEDLDSGELVVLELKRDAGNGDQVVGQISRYLAWVSERLAKPGQRVVGIICVRTISDALRLSASRVAGLELKTYGFTWGS